MEIVIKTILWQIITHYAGTQDIIKKLASCDPCGRKSGLKTVAELLRLSIYRFNSYATLLITSIGLYNQLEDSILEIQHFFER